MKQTRVNVQFTCLLQTNEIMHLTSERAYVRDNLTENENVFLFNVKL